MEQLSAFDDLLPSLRDTRDLIAKRLQPLVIADQHANYQLSYLLGRIEDVQLVVERLIEQNQRLILLAYKDAAFEPIIKPRPRFSKKRQLVHAEMHKLGLAMSLDLENLYIYSSLVLDHWAEVVRHISGITRTSDWRQPFANLYTKICSNIPVPELATLRASHETDIWWLFYNIREYRNKFIEHIDRPMQKGASRRVYYLGYNFFMPSASGSLTDTQFAAHYATLAHIEPQFVDRLPAGHWERKPKAVIERMMSQIDTVSSYDDRQLILKVWKAVGGESVSYETLIRRLMKLLRESVSTLA